MSAPSQERDQGTGGAGGSDQAGEVVVVVLVGLVGLLLAPPVGAWLLGPLWAQHPSAWAPASRRARQATAAGSVLGPLVLVVTAPLTLGLLWPPSLLGALAALSVWWVLLAPAALAVARLRARGQGTALMAGRCPPTIADNVRAAAWDATVADLARRAGARVQRPVQVLDAHALPAGVLGAAAVHDPRAALTRHVARTVHRDPQSSWHSGERTQGLLRLPVSAPRVAMFGSSGSGKTVAQHRIVVAALDQGWRVLWLDGKGHPDDARSLLAHAQRRDLAARWLDLSASDGRHPYDVWRGDSAAVARKAAALMPRSGEGGTEHFAAWETFVLTALARQPWRSTAELLARLHAPAQWVGQDDQGRQALRALNTKTGPSTKVIDTVAAQVTAALSPLARYVDGGAHGWSLDDDSGWDLAVASLDAGAVSGAERVAAALLLDLDAYRIARRAPGARPLLVIADELGAVLSDPRVSEVVPRLMEQLRSQGIGLVVAAQSPSTLGLSGPRLLASGLDLWVGRVDEPDALVMLMGTSKRAEQAHQGTESGAVWTGQTAAREQDGLLVDPSVLRNLPTWTWLVKEARCAPTWAVVPPVAPTEPREPREPREEPAEARERGGPPGGGRAAGPVESVESRR